ncbi:MAG: FG-GAP-like repeat-containing protein [Candidatus Latescibacterota bacterium]|nr:FG-GAP-like repeat-containing protein [Candidatus Latescibacterota bacterium]
MAKGRNARLAARLLVVAALVGLSCEPPIETRERTRSTEFEAAYRHGLKLLERYRLREAQHEFKRCIQLDAEAYEGHRQLGRVEVVQGRIAEGISRLHRALELEPGLTAARELIVETHLGRGREFLEEGEFDRAREHFQQALDVEPEVYEALHNSAITAVWSREFGRADSLLSRAIARHPQVLELRWLQREVRQALHEDERSTEFGGESKRYILEANGNGAAFFDYDGDGFLDLYVVNESTFETLGMGPGNSLFRNEGDGTFADHSDSAGVADRSWGSGVAVGDVDTDGDDDLYVTNFGPNWLYENRGHGQFRGVTAGSSASGASYSASAAFFDYYGDSDLDLYVTNYVEFDIADVPDDPAYDERCMYLGGIRVYCGPQGMIGQADRLYRNDGKGRFEGVTSEVGLGGANEYYGLGVVPEDFDGDGHIDIFVANDETQNVMFRNEGDGRFTDVAITAGVAFNGDGDREAGMGVDVADYDNDRDMDIHVTNF